MLHFFSLALIGAPPPQIVVPSLLDALLGWIMSLLVLLGPCLLVFASWQRRHGGWWYVFSQRNTTAFWLLLAGSVVVALGIFGLLDMIPTWQNAWNDWYLNMILSNPNADMSVLSWIKTTHEQYAFALQLMSSMLFVLGAVAVVIAQSRLARKMVLFQRNGTDDWLISSAEAPAASAVERTVHPITPSYRSVERTVHPVTSSAKSVERTLRPVTAAS